MPQITIRIDEATDAELWAAIRAIPVGQRTARLKRILETGFGVNTADILQRLNALERRMDAWEAGIHTPQAPSVASQPEVTGPALTPPGWKDSLAKLGAFND